MAAYKDDKVRTVKLFEAALKGDMDLISEVKKIMRGDVAIEMNFQILLLMLMEKRK